MGVLIKDMEKPKSCYAVIDGESEYCPFVNTDDDCVLLLKKGRCEGTWADQYSKCPLIETAEPCEDVEFWRKRAEYYSKMCFDLIADINKGVKIDSIEINEDGIKFTKKQTESCDDTVGRQAAIDAIKASSKEIQHWLWEAEGCEGYCAMVADVETCLDDLPSAQPERKRGKWSVEFSPAYKGGAYCECSQCNYKFAMGAYFEPDEWNFCPYCGADMRGEQDGSDGS